MSQDVGKAFDVVKDSYANTTVEDMRDFYDKWSSKYEADVDAIGWIGWKAVVDNLLEFADNDIGLSVLDYGCGTGYAGAYLRHRLPSAKITGVDVSQEMLDLAAGKKAYDKLRLIGGSQDLERDGYNGFVAVICSGVFTNSHMRAEELKYLVATLSRGGILSLSARESYCRTSGILDVINQLIETKTVSKLHEARFERYQINLQEEDAKGAYWVFQTLWS